MEIEQRTVFELSGLKLCLIGMLFKFINIRIGGFDLLPDVIGYIMVVVGLGRLELYSAGFRTAKKAASVLIILSLFNIFQVETETPVASGLWVEGRSLVTFDAGIFGHTAWIAALMLIVGAVFNLGFTFYLCSGMKDLSLLAGESFLAQLCKERWTFILIAQIGLIVSMIIAFLGSSHGAVAAIAFAILSFAAGGLLLFLIYEIWHRIDRREMHANE